MYIGAEKGKISVLDVRVVLDTFALGHGAESLEQRPQIGRLDDAVLAEVANVELHRDGAFEIDDLSLNIMFLYFLKMTTLFPVGVRAAE